MEGIEKYGLPPLLISLIRSFHEGMSAELKIDGEVIDGTISVTSGL